MHDTTGIGRIIPHVPEEALDTCGASSLGHYCVLPPDHDGAHRSSGGLMWFALDVPDSSVGVLAAEALPSFVVPRHTRRVPTIARVGLGRAGPVGEIADQVEPLRLDVGPRVQARQLREQRVDVGERRDLPGSGLVVVVQPATPAVRGHAACGVAVTCPRCHPQRPQPRHRWANARGGLHGPTALRRVLDSDRLREEVLEAMPDSDLTREVRRRERRRQHEEYQQAEARHGLMQALVRWWRAR